MKSTLTDIQAYDATIHFLNKMHNEFGWKQLGALLGSMALVDGVPMDAALINDWSEAVELSLRGGNGEPPFSGWTKEEAYIAMSYFLEQMFNAKHEDIGTLVHDMVLVNGKPCDSSVIEFWKKATEFVASGGKAMPHVVVKDGIAYELHHEKHGPKK